MNDINNTLYYPSFWIVMLALFMANSLTQYYLHGSTAVNSVFLGLFMALVYTVVIIILDSLYF